MKANELMLGDLLILKSNGKLPDSIVRIREIHIDGCFVDVLENNIFEPCDNFIDYSELSPIPLTEEILKANGWNKNGVYNDYILRGDIGGFIGYNADDRHTRIRIDGWNAQQEVYVSANFVHELQHALRLCGLSELADNFKVE